MHEPSPVTEFHASNSPALRAAGLAGRHVRGGLRDGAIELRGEAAGVLRLAPGDVDRLRVGYSDGARRAYELRVWRRGAREPLTIVPFPATWGAYRVIVARFVDALVAAGATERIEAGSSRVEALLAPVSLGLVALAAWAIALFVLDDEPWWGRLLVPAVPTGLALLLSWIGTTRHWPRPVRAPAELERQLPPVAGGKAARAP